MSGSLGVAALGTANVRLVHIHLLAVVHIMPCKILCGVQVAEDPQDTINAFRAEPQAERDGIWGK